MSLLVDTHYALWFATGSDKLPVQARELIEQAGEGAYVSAASVWEIAIKHATGRGGANAMPIDGATALDAFLRAGFTILSISAEHAAAVDGLPPLHGDPFDRLLVAQAKSEPMRLLTRDARLAGYGELVTVV
ncbi:MAG TPA: type II toxin-antitoxin system VapC family toxin [Caulobacteraceae bacterium]|nr:type II toxin-antitoxin system VapC family toxin [Caulobacteraceae bacterium]